MMCSFCAFCYRGPPGCDCADCPKTPVGPLIMTHHWADFRTGDDFPTGKAVRALNRSLQTVPAENPDQFVALWWKDCCMLLLGGHEYRKNIGSLQILFELPEHVRGFDYDWRPFPEAAKFGDKEWHPVHVNHHKGDISPGVVMVDGKELLGKVDVRNERASAGTAGAEKLLVGPAVHSCKVLCRRAKPGCKFD
uniref:Uncharacterized protein n=1 Tax=Ditylenchus dipsaci TaxID=166011 RepID=A0A915CMK5_9BILA